MAWSATTDRSAIFASGYPCALRSETILLSAWRILSDRAGAPGSIPYFAGSSVCRRPTIGGQPAESDCAEVELWPGHDVDDDRHRRSRTPVDLTGFNHRFKRRAGKVDIHRAAVKALDVEQGHQLLLIAQCSGDKPRRPGRRRVLPLNQLRGFHEGFFQVLVAAGNLQRGGIGQGIGNLVDHFLGLIALKKLKPKSSNAWAEDAISTRRRKPLRWPKMSLVFSRRGSYAHAPADVSCRRLRNSKHMR